MRHVIAVRHQKLKRVLARRQFDNCLGLAATEMQVMLVIRYGLIERRQIGVDQQMVMTCASVRRCRRVPRRSRVSRTRPELASAYYRAVYRPADIDVSVMWRRHARAGGRGSRRGGRSMLRHCRLGWRGGCLCPARQRKGPSAPRLISAAVNGAMCRSFIIALSYGGTMMVIFFE